ncbi:putative ABC transporter ATP-binding protein [Spirochaetia bacterium]|nr:putative ABC transporter ATP-binding protein [Spirochaetia bacterium]
MISLRKVTAAYPDGTLALKDISFDLAPGETTALMGANGAGKTSLLLAMVGILPINSGSIAVEDIELFGETHGTAKSRTTALEELRRRVALVFQNPEDQLFMPSIYEDLAFGPRNLGLSEEEVSRRVEEVLAQLGIVRLRDRSPLKLSGGEKRLAAIATVLTMEPRVMLFDEPTAFLDPRARRSLTAVIRELPHTTLVATHDFAFAKEVCSRVILLREGQLVDQGPAEKILGDSNLLEEVFFNSTEPNLQ